jgi:hypothetical protein
VPNFPEKSWLSSYLIVVATAPTIARVPNSGASWHAISLIPPHLPSRLGDSSRARSRSRYRRAPPSGVPVA